MRAIIQKLSDSTTEFGGIAQLGERLNGIQEVSGSIPLISTTKVPKSASFGTFSFVLRRKSSSFSQAVAGVQLPDRNLTGIEINHYLGLQKASENRSAASRRTGVWT